MIPHLEVLKLKMHAFVGEVWETTEGVFPQLKVLKLEDLDIVKWDATSSHFPKLQRLAVHRCPNLIEIPASFGNIYTLELIELSGCGYSAVNSVINIQKEEESNDNNFLKILINPTTILQSKMKHNGRCNRGRIHEKIEKGELVFFHFLGEKIIKIPGKSSIV